MRRLFGWRRQRARVVLWDEHRLVYFRVPKSGNTSIAAAIPRGEKTRLCPRRLARAYEGWTTFSFVRNPYARLVSTYCQKIHPEPFTAGNVIDGVHHRFVEMGLPLRAGMSFREFVEVVCELDDEQTEKHLKSQSHHLFRDGRMLPDFVGRLESMVDDWQRLADRIGLSYQMPHLNRSRRRDWRSYYREPGLRKLVATRYQQDFENFGYPTRFDV